MAYIGTKNYYFESVKGKNATTVVHKFGRNDAVGTTFVPIALGGVYPTPTSPVVLEFVSGDTADALDDTGMHAITVIGLDSSWQEQTVVANSHATDGLTAVALPGNWLRVYRAFVSSSGAYASASQGSHVGDITIRISGAGATYGSISATDFPRGQTEIGVYTVPNGKTAYIASAFVNVDSTKVATVLFFQRPFASDVVSSYQGVMRVVFEMGGVAGGQEIVSPNAPLGPFVGPCDIGFMGKVGATTGEIDCDFEILLEDSEVLDSPIYPSLGSVVFTGVASVISIGPTANPADATITFTGFAPDVIAEIMPSAVAVTFTGFAPTVT